MHIHLLQARSAVAVRTSKDTNGGYGTANDFGDGITARLLRILKAKVMTFPELLPAYAAAILRQLGHRVSFGDNLMDNSADLVLLQTSTVHHAAEREWAQRIRCDSPKTRIGFVGGLATGKPELYADVADFVIAGELESALLREDLAKLSGVVRTGVVEDLEQIPFPDWDHARDRSPGYGLLTKRRARGGFFPMLTSRGCPLSCGFYCTYPLTQGKAHRTRSAEHVIAEIEYLQRDYAMTSVLFRDPIFSLDMARIERLCETIVQRQLKFDWICETHTNCLTPELIALMAKAGCISIKVGIESGNSEVMKKSHRAPTRESRQLDVLRACEKHGIKILAFYILGYMHDSEESIRQTIDYAIRLNTYGAQFTIATPYPGTPWYEELRAADGSHGLSERMDDYTQYDLVFRHQNLSKDRLHALKSEAYRRYYLRPSYLLRHHLRFS